MFKRPEVWNQGISGMGSFWKLRENLFHASPSFWYPGNPWPALASGGITLIPASIFTWLCVSVSLLSSLIRTPVMELGPTLNQYDLMLICWTITCAKLCFQIWSLSEVPGDCEFWRTLIQLPTQRTLNLLAHPPSGWHPWLVAPLLGSSSWPLTSEILLVSFCPGVFKSRLLSPFPM